MIRAIVAPVLENVAHIFMSPGLEWGGGGIWGFKLVFRSETSVQVQERI